MSWDDHKRRRAALILVLERAEQDPNGGLPYEELPQVRKAFADRSDLILALQYRWSQALWSRIELISCDVQQPSDPAAMARLAWTQCAEANPVLRRLLDTHLNECGRSVEAVRQREQDLMLAGAMPESRVRRYHPPEVA